MANEAFFSGADTAVISDKLPPLRAAEGGGEATYLLKINAHKAFKDRKGIKRYVLEVQVVESTGAGANAPGTQASWMTNLSNDNGIGNVMKLAGAIGNVPARSIKDKDLNDLVEKQLGVGHLVRAQASVITTRAGDPFTLCTFTHVPKTGESTATAIPTAGDNSKTARK